MSTDKLQNEFLHVSSILERWDLDRTHGRGMLGFGPAQLHKHRGRTDSREPLFAKSLQWFQSRWHKLPQCQVVQKDPQMTSRVAQCHLKPLYCTTVDLSISCFDSYPVYGLGYPLVLGRTRVPWCKPAASIRQFSDSPDQLGWLWGSMYYTLSLQNATNRGAPGLYTTRSKKPW